MRISKYGKSNASVLEDHRFGWKPLSWRLFESTGHWLDDGCFVHPRSSEVSITMIKEVQYQDDSKSRRWMQDNDLKIKVKKIKAQDQDPKQNE
ncbi:hypothetical protein Tco_0860276 [Tanacetum coccineum]|uniref:Uncharacterized protein n=1 Tax=Tanacetum coccineum TaxID=301880 RepID=A0ABQ5BG77_9ASTR